jgi:uncharacterized protein YeaO (DUF488 family)
MIIQDPLELVASCPSLPWAHPVNGRRAAVDRDWPCGVGKRRRGPGKDRLTKENMFFDWKKTGKHDDEEWINYGSLG